jgi:hypothetical protein
MEGSFLLGVQQLPEVGRSFLEASWKLPVVVYAAGFCALLLLYKERAPSQSFKTARPKQLLLPLHSKGDLV